jgi:hypothetical protein
VLRHSRSLTNRTFVSFTRPVFTIPKTLPLTLIVAKSYIQASIIQPATDDARPTGFQKRPFKRKHQQPLIQFSGSKGFSPHVRKN